MMEHHGLDLDGTVLPYDVKTVPEKLSVVHINRQLVAALRQRGIRSVSIVTNQGGVGWYTRNPALFPSPKTCVHRMLCAVRQLRAAGIQLDLLLASTYHPRLPANLVASAAAGIRRWISSDILVPVELVEYWRAQGLAGLDGPIVQDGRGRDRVNLGKLSQYVGGWRVYETPASRKPESAMLTWAGLTHYWGDSMGDRDAAYAAGIEFVPVIQYREFPAPTGTAWERMNKL